jgi:ABC-2 type transport system permease protein
MEETAMINKTLFFQEIKRSYKLLLIFIAIMVMYITMIISMFDPSLGKTLEEFAKAMPGLMSMFGMETTGSTLLEFISNYLYGFIMLIFPLAFVIIMANKLIAFHVYKGSMTYLLASPNTRTKVVFTQMFVLLTMMIVLLLVSIVIELISAQAMFPDSLDISKFMEINLGMFALMIAVSGFCFFISCISNETKLSLTLGAGIPTVFYLIKMLANMGGKLENMKYATIFSLFDTDKIIAGDGDVWFMNVILLIIGIVFYSSAFYFFKRRDLPL